MALTKKLSRRSSTQALVEHFNRMATKDDFERLRDAWFGACHGEGIELNPKVSAEFQKRIERGNSFGDRAKLDLSDCDINDRQFILLVETLARKPTIYRLDLDRNRITDEGLRLLKALLRGQLQLVKDFPVDKRLSASFLAEVSLAENPIDMQSLLMQKIRQMLKVLKYVNAQAFVRSIYFNSSAPEQMSYPFVMKMWLNIVGKPEEEQITPAFVAARVPQNTTLVYSQLEAVILQGLIQKDSLEALNVEELAMIGVKQMSPISRKDSWDSPPPNMANMIMRNASMSVDREFGSSLDHINILDNRYSLTPTSSAVDTFTLAGPKKGHSKAANSVYSSDEDEDNIEEAVVNVTHDLDNVLIESNGVNNIKRPPLVSVSGDSSGSDSMSIDVPSHRSPRGTNFPRKVSLSSESSSNSPKSLTPKAVTPSAASRRDVPSALSTVVEVDEDELAKDIDGKHAPHPVPISDSVAVPLPVNADNRPTLEENHLTNAVPVATDQAESISVQQNEDSVASDAGVKDIVGGLTVKSELPNDRSNSWSPSKRSAFAPLSAISSPLPPPPPPQTVCESMTSAEEVKHADQLTPEDDLLFANNLPASPPATALKKKQHLDLSTLHQFSPDDKSRLSTENSNSPRRNSRSTTPTPMNVLRAQRESQLRTPQSVLLEMELEKNRKKEARSTLLSSEEGDHLPTISDTAVADDCNHYYSSPSSERKESHHRTVSNEDRVAKYVSANPTQSSPTRTRGARGHSRQQTVSDAEDEHNAVQPSPLLIPAQMTSVIKRTTDQSSRKELDLTAQLKVSEEDTNGSQGPGFSMSLSLSLYLSADEVMHLRVLVLQSVSLTTTQLLSMSLPSQTPRLTDLDLSHNALSGKLIENAMPKRLLRLDLSHNALSDVTALFDCVQLQSLDISHNSLKTLYGLPPLIHTLRLHSNKLQSLNALRSLVMCSGLQSLTVAENPLVANLGDNSIRVVVMSLFRQLRDCDGVGVLVHARSPQPPASTAHVRSHASAHASPAPNATGTSAAPATKRSNPSSNLSAVPKNAENPIAAHPSFAQTKKSISNAPETRSSVVGSRPPHLQKQSVASTAAASQQQSQQSRTAVNSAGVRPKAVDLKASSQAAHPQSHQSHQQQQERDRRRSESHLDKQKHIEKMRQEKAEAEELERRRDVRRVVLKADQVATLTTRLYAAAKLPNTSANANANAAAHRNSITSNHILSILQETAPAHSRTPRAKSPIDSSRLTHGQPSVPSRQQKTVPTDSRVHTKSPSLPVRSRSAERPANPVSTPVVRPSSVTQRSPVSAAQRTTPRATTSSSRSPSAQQQKRSISRLTSESVSPAVRRPTAPVNNRRSSISSFATSPSQGFSYSAMSNHSSSVSPLPRRREASPQKQWERLKQGYAEREKAAKLEMLRYIDSLQLEQGRLAAVFRLVFLLLDKPALSIEDAEVLRAACEKETLALSLALPASVAELLQGDLALSFVEERHKVSLLRAQLEQCVQLLTQVQTLTALSIDSGASFHDAVSLAMHSALGKAVNDQVLVKHGCAFGKFSSPHGTPKRLSHLDKSPQRHSPTHLRSPPKSDFVYKIREEEATPEPAGSSTSPEKSTVATQLFLPADDQQLAMDRVRSRVERRFQLPGQSSTVEAPHVPSLLQRTPRTDLEALLQQENENDNNLKIISPLEDRGVDSSSLPTTLSTINSNLSEPPSLEASPARESRALQALTEPADEASKVTEVSNRDSLQVDSAKKQDRAADSMEVKSELDSPWSDFPIIASCESLGDTEQPTIGLEPTPRSVDPAGTLDDESINSKSSSVATARERLQARLRKNRQLSCEQMG